MFSFATVRRSSTSALATARATTLARQDVQRVLHEHLQPVLGAKHCASVVAQLLQHVQLVAALDDGGRTVAGARGPGQSVATAYLRWQLPIRASISHLPPQLQGRVEWILLRDIVRWNAVAQPPAWATNLPLQADYYRVVLVEEARLPNDAQAASLENVRLRVEAELLRRLAPVIGKQMAAVVAERALAKLAPVERATWFREEHVDPADPGAREVVVLGKPTRKVSTAYVLWEIPLASLGEGLPEETAKKLLRALSPASGKQ